MAAVTRGPRHDRFTNRATGVGHGAQFDQFNRVAVNPHGPQSDEHYGPSSDDPEVEHQLNQIASHIRRLPPHHRQRLLTKLGWSESTTNKTRGDREGEYLDVMKTDRQALGIEVADDGSLHAALVQSVNRSLAAGAYRGRARAGRER